MVDKKFNYYDMRDEFSLPVYVGYDLVEFSGIKGIDPDNRFAGQLIRENGVTYLELSDIPAKRDYVNTGVVFGNEDKIQTQEDDYDWYATTWDGNLLFVLHKYLQIAFNQSLANNHFSGATSKWIIDDYSIVNQFMLADSVSQVELTLDSIYSWFNIFRPNQDWEHTKSKEFKDLKFHNQKFSLKIGAKGQVKNNLHSFEKTADMYVSIEFNKVQDRDFTYQIAVTLRNFFQILIGRDVGISRIILNKDHSAESANGKPTARDFRENWFLEQSYLPKPPVETIFNFDVPYSDIADSFNLILTKHLLDTKMQKFISTYLVVDQFRVPVDTQIVTLVSAIETYYHDTVYSSNGNKVRKALKKLKLLVRLVDEPNRVIAKDVHGTTTDTDQLLQEMVDVRDFVVHGDKEDKYTSEVDLVPDLLAFKRLIRRAMLEVITLEKENNNELVTKTD